MNALARFCTGGGRSLRKYFLVALTACLLLLLCGCFSLSDTQKHSVSIPPAAAQKAASVKQKAEHLKEKKSAALPDTLGGVVTSDRWVIYKEKAEEVLEGNVHYDNGIYAFRSDYALSQRKQNLFTAKGQVYARYNEENGARYELYADKAVYNYQSGQGRAEAASGKKIKLIYHTAKGELITAWARKAEFNTQTEEYHLTGNTFVTYRDAEGKISTLKAQEITARQKENYAILQGNAEAQNDDYHLKAQTIEYNGQQGYTYAYGGRPLLQGKTQDGTFAIIADKVTAENTSRKIKLAGQVEGWTVSEQINSSRANESL